MNTSVRLSTLDLPALMNQLQREAVGFDKMFHKIHHYANSPESVKYPPHNIVKLNDNCYTVEVATAGFKEEELTVTLNNNVLTITGEQQANDKEYLHRGISTRSFSKSLNLAEHVTVNSANYENGMLIINLEIVVPEELKPRRIAIGTSDIKAIAQ